MFWTILGVGAIALLGVKCYNSYKINQAYMQIRNVANCKEDIKRMNEIINMAKKNRR